MYFEYGDAETEYLKARDPSLAAVMERTGHIYRETDPDIFSAVVHQIIGQQISSKAQATVWDRLQKMVGRVDAETVAAAGAGALQRAGMSQKKAECVVGFAEKVLDGSFDSRALEMMTDAEAVDALTSLRGVGRWTAEMILLFCLQRKDVFAADDFGIRKGVRMVYGHTSLTKELMEKYRELYSPYGSVASLYLWEVAGGRAPGYTGPVSNARNT